MEEKKKDLLRRLTIISIPFVFVAIPSIVIIVGMLSPHAAEPRDAAAEAAVPARNHSVSMLSTMTGGQMILSCRAAFSGNWEYFHYFILDPYKPQRAFFQPAAEPYAILCKWGYMGNFLQDVVVFNSSAAYAHLCRVDEGGCRYLFQDGHMFLVTGRHATMAAPAHSREKTLVGDVLLRDCVHVLGVFPTVCRYKPHDNPYVGKIIGRWRWWFNY
ncbi:hypothetical protein GUJ93_ZPchr0008g13202 [Zizania palustris]|uniref:DUF7771 domain-containing protein n=1 Tax=Zizania palustris TaxID=103762 RepID=A0A8J5RLU8_ZIZPA|nr:hypothetical protein GUJ93_ZPchr0008g13202 [Zizania palustris]